jgi:hypothetical protein
MSIPRDLELYNDIKKNLWKKYKKNSAYRSGMLVKIYKELGGQFKGEKNKDVGLSRWFREEWTDVNPYKNTSSYPVYRPTIRINENTPKTLGEISKSRLVEQSKLKQKIRGRKNLPPF